jgi:hypothetical protein
VSLKIRGEGKRVARGDRRGEIFSKTSLYFEHIFKANSRSGQMLLFIMPWKDFFSLAYIKKSDSKQSSPF